MGLCLVYNNIFYSNCEVITITVNCVGVMGKGIALTAAKMYPELESRYKILCEQNLILPGKPRLITLQDKKKFLLFPTKNHWRYDSQIEWINNGLRLLSQNLQEFKSIALPPLGCGNGNLNFLDVFNLILKHLEGVDCRIDIHVPKSWS